MSVSGSDRYPPSPAPGRIAGPAYEEKVSDLPSSPQGSGQRPFSWQSSTGADSRFSTISEEGGYQSPTMIDGFWHNAQELPAGTSPNSNGANGQGAILNKTPSRPIVPRGKWPPAL